MTRLVPWIVVALAAAWVATAARPVRTPEGEMRLDELGSIPVKHLGRVKPLDTVARTTLLTLSRRQTFKADDGKSYPAMRWLMDVMGDELWRLDVIGDELWRAPHRVFRIDHPDLLTTLKLEPRPGSCYAVAEFIAPLRELGEQAGAAQERREAGEKLDAFETKLIELVGHVSAYIDLVLGDSVLALPPATGQTEWRPMSQATDQEGGEAAALLEVLRAYQADDVARFNAAVTAYRALIDPRFPREASKARFEVFFNRFEPFYCCSILYVIVFILGCAAWLGWSGPLGRASFALTAFTWVLHTAALVARVLISGQAPVTNLYSSAVFIGWGGALLALVLERVYRLGVGTVIASVLGFATLIVAHFLSLDGDTVQVLPAVLDTQFWLATHVTCITLGYSATYVAGLIGILYVLRGVLTPSLSPAAGQGLARMAYGTICFALFFSFVGTVLGGLWADDSWGRFWGWDPKENGALIIVLWNALILHAWRDEWASERALALLAVFGNVVTTWSWFGVNQLGVGLHAYGFTSGVDVALWTTYAAHMLIIGVGLLPRSLWWSVRLHPGLDAPAA